MTGGQITQYLVNRHVQSLVKQSEGGTPITEADAQRVIENISTMKGLQDLKDAFRTARKAEMDACERADMALGSPVEVQTHMVQSRLFSQIADAARDRVGELHKAQLAK
jgi:hypothetical protein